MKKIIATIIPMLSGVILFAQAAENDLKNFRFGVKVTPSVNWYKTEGKILKENGSTLKFGGGLMLEYQLSKSVSFVSGIQIDMDGGKIKYNNGGLTTPSANSVSYYYYNPDDKIVKPGDMPNPSDSVEYAKYSQYQLNSREYKVTYITIPLTLKMKTKEIGLFSYYGQVGINASFRWKAKATDEVSLMSTSSTETKSNIDISKDMSFFRSTLNIGLGAEMNISGSTSLIFGINYMPGFTNSAKKESDYLVKRTNDPIMTGSTLNYTLSEMPQKLKSNIIGLTVGILF